MALYNSRGNVLVSSGSGVGSYTYDGKMRITEVVGSSWTGLYAANGSVNVVIVSSSDTPQGLYHACGALRVAEATSETGAFAPNGALYVEGTSGGGATFRWLMEDGSSLVLMEDGSSYVLTEAG